MQLRKYKDLGIVSAQVPKHTHVFVETSDGTLWLAQAADPQKLYYSVDKSDNWVLKTTREDSITMFYYDRTNERVYGVDGTRADGNSSHQFYISTSNKNITEGDLAGATDEMTDIIWDGVRAFAMKFVKVGGALGTVFFWAKEFSAAWQDSVTTDDVFDGKTFDMSPGVVISGWYYFLYWHEDNNLVKLYKYQINADVWTNLAETAAGIKLDPTTKSRQGIAYDGSDNLSFVLLDTGDSKYYLYTYNITGDTLTKGAEHNVALMLDRNNVGTAPNEYEKGFGITNEITYEIKARRGGIRQLQDCSDISDANLIAITDNFLMNSDGDMFEYTDVTSEIGSISYSDGIMGVRKKGSMIIHPDFENRWSKEDSIKIYDQYDQLEFWGKIIDKNRNNRGLYVIKFDSFTNEVLSATYSTTYSADDTDTKQKDIIDNALDFCYHSSSIVGTTTIYDYVYNRAVIYLFWLARRLERQVPYIEPDGKIWTKAHDGLAKNDMIYPGTYNFKDEADGTSGTDIDFVDIATVGANTTATIIALLDGHRKVLQLYDNDAGAQIILTHDFSSGQIIGTIEFWIETTDATKRSLFQVDNEGDTNSISFMIDADKFQYTDGGGANDVGLAASDDTLYHIKLIFSCTTDTYEIWIDGTQYQAAAGFQNVATTLDRIQIYSDDVDSGYYTYYDAFGYSWDPAYTVGDNEVAWDLANHWQNAWLVDIPGIQEIIQGFFDGNTGITRNTIRYKDNAEAIRPVEATREPIEQLKGISRLNEFRDPKIEAATEANQLGDNRYAMWSADTIFLGLRIEGQGYLQPGKTIHIENTGQVTIAESNLLLLSFVRDPKNDVYSQMILSDNIIFPSEFISIDNTTPQQIHTGIVQSFENQANLHKTITLDSGQYITSADEDLIFTFGRCKIGTNPGDPDYAVFAHRDRLNATQYAFSGDPFGGSRFNARAGQKLDLKIGNVDKLRLSNANNFQMFVEASMQTNKLINVGDPSNAQDAVTLAYLEKRLTPEGGIALSLTNKTGVNSVKGTIVEAHAGTDNAFRVCDASSIEAFGVVYENGIADGSECMVVVGGRCQVLLKDATLSTRNNWVGVSDVAGRADATGASPAAAPQHFKEIGHCIESKGADTDVLAYIILHFL